MNTIKHNGVDICAEFNLKLQNGVVIGYPELVMNTLLIPDADEIDITTDQSYSRRSIEWSMIVYREAGRGEVIEAAQAYINAYNGKRCDISFTWTDGKHFIGRISAVELELLDNEHAIIKCRANCDPYMFSDDETIVTLSSGSNSVTVEGLNAVPTVSNATDADITLTIGSNEWTVSAGADKVTLHGLELDNGTTDINSTGELSIRFTERFI